MEQEWQRQHRSWAALEALVEHFESRVEPKGPPAGRFYGWQPLSLIDFLDGMDVAKDRGHFLDVGSGLGTKLKLADALGWAVEGLEIYEPYAEVSRQLFADFKVELGDAFDYQRYGSFDLVYCYRLCIASDDQDQLNHWIADQLKPGALFFSAGGPWPEWLEHVDGQVWRK
jgi:SAM-dependent methyltransferase